MLSLMWQVFVFSLSIMLPIMLMLALGFWLRKRGRITDEFSQQGSQLVFSVTLPALLFLSIFNSSIDVRAQMAVVSAGLGVSIILFILAEMYAKKYIAKRSERGIFVQGVFRANLGIVGLALCSNAYGEKGLAIGSVYVAVVTILFNILAVITLTRSLSATQGVNIRSILARIVKNPLILAILAGFLAKSMGLYIPEPFLHTGQYLAKVSLPLALICAGASLDFRRVKNASTIAFQATLGRIVVAPLITLVVAVSFGLHGVSLGVIFLMSIVPTASASYPMVRAFGGDEKIAANIIGLSTVGSLFTGVIGLAILRQLGWI